MSFGRSLDEIHLATNGDVGQTSARLREFTARIGDQAANVAIATRASSTEIA
jgi:hypothetical protein